MSKIGMIFGLIVVSQQEIRCCLNSG